MGDEADTEIESTGVNLVEIRRRALDLLARREHSATELRRKLIARQFPENAVGQVLARLQHEGLQSDERFTESYLNHRFNAGFGPLKIRHELLRKGISDDLIQGYLEPMHDQWDELMTQQRVRKFGQVIPGNMKECMRQARFLQNRGFSPESVMRLFR